MFPICSRKIASAHWPGIGHSKGALQPFNLGNGLFKVHPSQYLTEEWARSIEPAPRDLTGVAFSFFVKPGGKSKLEFERLNHLQPLHEVGDTSGQVYGQDEPCTIPLPVCFACELATLRKKSPMSITAPLVRSFLRPRRFTYW